MTFEMPEALAPADAAVPRRSYLPNAELATTLAGAWMPSPPQLLLRVMAVVDEETAGLDELATLISRDPGLCSRVLTVANSPALRRGRELRRIEDCVAVLGTRFVRTMAACLAVQAAFGAVARQVECDLSAFWLHSLEVAELARAIALVTPHANPEEAYLAGLLHDTGQLLLLTSVPNYVSVLIAANNETVLSELEQTVLGTDHGAVGAWLIDQWHIDSFLADAILFHHESAPHIAEGDRLTRILWAAHAATVAADGLPAEVAAVAGLDPDNLASLRAESRQRTSGIAAALGIATSDGGGTLPVPTGIAAPPSPAAAALVDAAQGMAFAQPLQQSLFAVTSDEEMLLTVQESARILFGLGRMALLTIDEGRQFLSGARIGGQSTLLQRLEIPLSGSSALTVRTVLTGAILSSFDPDDPSVHLADIQIQRALGGEGLLCVPLAVRHKCRGVMVFGVSRAQWTRVSRRLNWLANFARIVAASLEAARDAIERQEANVAAASSRYRLHARQIAHEAGNPLSIIRNYLKLLERKLDHEEPVARELAFIDEEIARVAQIIRELGDPAEADTETLRCDLGALIEELLAGYGAPLFSSRGITVSIERSPVHAIAAVRREALHQVLLNLWKNASEAMPEGGKFHIEVVAGASEGGRCLIEVRLQDSGPGLPPQTWARLSGGATADYAGGSRGLGLGIVVQRVAAMGGRILCASQPGRGTLFSILLPAVEDSA